MSVSPQTFPGLRSQSGSKAVLRRPNASQRSSPYSFLFHCVRARPSPCSPETEPPSSTTRSVTSSAMEAIAATPSALFVSISGRTWSTPGPAWA